MANKDKGEVSLVVGGTSYTLVLTLGGMMEAETAASTPAKEVFWDEIVARMQRGSARDSLFYVYALFRKHHPTLTLEDVSTVVDDAGGFEGTLAAVEAGQVASSPDPADLKELGPSTKRPQKAQGARGTGASSTSRRAASA